MARNKGTGSSREIHRQRVTGRMEDREKKRKGTGRGHRWRKKHCPEREEESDRTEAER